MEAPNEPSIPMTNPGLTSMLDAAQHAMTETPDVAFDLALRVHAAAVEVQDGSVQARSLRLMASARFYQSRLLDAQLLAEQALSTARLAQDASVEVEALNSLSVIAHHLGDFSAAMEWRLSHLDLVTAQQNQNGMFHALNNIGNLYGELDEFEDAYEKHQAAARLAEALQDVPLQAIATMNMGEDLTQLNRHEEARLLNQSAVELSRTTGNLIALGAALANLACSLNALGDAQAAHAPAREAVEIAERLGDRIAQSYALEMLGRAFLTLGDANALPVLEESLRVLEPTEAKGRQRDAHAALSAAYEAVGDPARALKHLQASYLLDRSVHSQKVDQKIKAVTARLELQRLRDEAAHERQARQALADINEELASTVDKVERANQALEQLTEQLWQQANTDALTGLLNRSAFVRVLEQKIDAAQAEGGRFVVVFIDLDEFKAVNDRLGHDVGDRLLVIVAERFRQALSQTATIARLSGDEFMLLLEDPDELYQVESLLKALSHPVDISGHPIRISASAGACEYPGSGLDVHSLIIQADRAMYRAKHLGKGQVHQALPSSVEGSGTLSSDQ